MLTSVGWSIPNTKVGSEVVIEPGNFVFGENTTSELFLADHAHLPH